MTRRSADVDEARKLFGLADAAWRAELIAIFGKAWEEARLTPLGRGATGSRLRRLYTLRRAVADHCRAIGAR